MTQIHISIRKPKTGGLDPVTGTLRFRPVRRHFDAAKNLIIAASFDARTSRSDWVAVAESAEDCALSMALLANAAFVCASAVMDSNVLMAIAAFMVVAVSSKSTTASGYRAESVSASDWVEAWRTFNSWEPAISFGTNVPASTSTRSAYATTWVEFGTST